jgi:hypothetical protein
VGPVVSPPEFPGQVTDPPHGPPSAVGYPFGPPPLRFDSPHAVYDIKPGGPPACAPYEDTNGPLLIGDPLLDSPSWAPPGWFGAVEVDAVGPHIKNRIAQFVGPAGDFVHLPTPLDWTASPIFQVGYRFGQGGGELILSFQSLSATGSTTLSGFDAAGNAGAVQGRLDVEVLDFSYASREFSLGPICDMKWFAGLRWGTTNFHSNATSALLQEAVSNNFWGLGPAFGLNLSRYCPHTGLDAFCRFDIAFLYGPVTQLFQETFTPAGLAQQAPPGSDVGGLLRQQHDHLTPIPRLDVGLGWRPPWNESLHFMLGYTIQEWYDLGNNDNGPKSRAYLTVQGVFVRGEWKY